MLKDFLKHAGRIADATGDAVVEGMTRLHPGVFENLLTDNGRQFCRMNSAMRRYCESRITGKHIWSSVHHPQTLGKLSAFQNSGWDNNVPSSSYFSETWPEFCTIVNPTEMQCTVNTSMVGAFSGSVTFHREGATNNWFANPLNPANTIKLLTSSGGPEYGFMVYGGVLQFSSGTPSANTFVGGKIASWGYNLPSYISPKSFPQCSLCSKRTCISRNYRELLHLEFSSV